MKVGLAQFDIIWEKKEENRKNAELIMEQARKGQVELLIFPEMTLTGFSMNTAQVGERFEESSTLSFFKECSVRYQMAIIFGWVEKTEDGYYNKLTVVADGEILLDYKKIHPFSCGKESFFYQAGSEVSVADYKGLKRLGFICYDLRFPESLQAVSDVAEAIVVIANWPRDRVKQWEALLRARAIENQCYIFGVNRIGSGNGCIYEESTIAFDPLGEALSDPTKKEPLQIIEVSAEVVKSIRKQFPFKQDRKPELYRNFYAK